MMNEDTGIFVGPNDGKVLTNPIGGQIVVKVHDEDTAGAYSIHDNIIPPGSLGPRPHLHRDHEEAFYVLEGELHVRVGPRTITAPRVRSWWCREASSISPPTWEPCRPGCCSYSPPQGWVASSRRRPRDSCRCRWSRAIRRS
jgi:cupin domain